MLKGYNITRIREVSTHFFLKAAICDIYQGPHIKNMNDTYFIRVKINIIIFTQPTFTVGNYGIICV